MEEWVNAGKGTGVSCILPGEDLINAVMKPGSESKTADNEFSDEEIVIDKISLAKAADSFSKLLKSSESRPCY